MIPYRGDFPRMNLSQAKNLSPNRLLAETQ